MGRPEERYARLLYDKLVGRMDSATPGVDIGVGGAGVHWQCLAHFGSRASITHCFAQLGEEYLTIFKQDDDEIATARTQSLDDTAEAVGCWINGEALTFLYDRFVCVDQQKRELSQICNGIEKIAPDLRRNGELRYRGSGLYYFRYRSEARSAVIYLYGREDAPRVMCHWDGCELFAFRADDVSLTGGVLKRWLCDSAMPSTMRKEFPWLVIGELADFYERGNPIEGEFVESWNRIEKFYDNLHFRPKLRVLQIISQLRQGGYDRKLRAGQSMDTFMLSRSRRHGLRVDQARIECQFSWEDDLMQVTFRNGAEEHVITSPVCLTDQLSAALNGLVKIPVD